jgi:hypothetical protein
MRWVSAFLGVAIMSLLAIYLYNKFSGGNVSELGKAA